ncbi:hypothetical protein FGO68_gene14319 [Halteria grandinella]|uniref:Endonuclease/exonuclease/phosphatase domain-containing protein n=1 Tax=Halteria grandinella TaxID=5974 RepID=A0A8J8T2F6_HALGN|nr:hypothetical protein FGO68_gene14319 [Halteria grandinella]
MGSYLSTKNKRGVPPPLPFKDFLSQVHLHMHPLNKHLLTPESQALVPIVKRGEDSQTIRMLTFNMCLVPVCFSPLVYAPYQAQRMQEFVLHYAQNYDILCLQEVIGLLWEVKDQFLTAMRKAGFFYVADPKRPDIFSDQEVCEGGVIIFSRFEIVEWEFLPFSYSVDAEGHSVIGSVYACVKVPEKADTQAPSRFMHLFNVHTMSNSSFSDPFIVYESMICRQQQITELAQFVKAKLGEISTKHSCFLGHEDLANHMAIICGDFNVNALEESEDVKAMLLKAHPENIKFLEEAKLEYAQMVEKLSHSIPSSLVDMSQAQLGGHPRTFIHINTCREMNKREEYQIEVNQCYDYIFEKKIGDHKNISVKPNTMKIERFDSHDHHPWPAVSDHCGLSIDIKIKPTQTYHSDEVVTIRTKEATTLGPLEEDTISLSTTSGSVRTLQRHY